MNPKVSVIIPVYNVEKYLRQALESVVNQTLEDLEIICINDGSPDNSLEILKEFEQKDPRINLIDKQNGGYGAACNLGFDISKGEYVTVLEPDDFIDRKMYEDLYFKAKEENADVIKSPFFNYIDKNEDDEEKIEKINWQEWGTPQGNFRIEDYPQFFFFHPSIWSCLYRREFLDKNNIRFVEAKGAGWVDNPFQFETFYLAKKLTYCDEAYYYYRFINPEASSVLKDFSIPFKRCNEIYEFLKAQQIQDNNMLAFLYKKELDYIKLVIESAKVSQLQGVKEDISRTIRRMNPQIIENHTAISKEENTLYKTLLLSLATVSVS